MRIPLLLALLLVAWMLLAVLLQRLMIPGPATFNASAIHSGWLGSLLALWLCWLVVSPATNVHRSKNYPPTAATLFGLLLAQGLVIEVVSGAVLVPLMHAGWLEPDAMPRSLAWTLVARALGRGPCLRNACCCCASRRRGASLRAFVVLVSGVPLALNLWAEPPPLWHADARNAQPHAPRFRVTQELIEAQAPLLRKQLQRLQASGPAWSICTRSPLRRTRRKTFSSARARWLTA